jgi:hypothetical protein
MDFRITYYTADGAKAGSAILPSKRTACAAARAFVSRNDLNSYRIRREADGQIRYYHSDGEREALVSKIG